MINARKVRELMREVIINSAIIDPEDIAYEGRTFKPEGKTLWLRETYLPVSDTPDNDHEEAVSGIMRYDVFVPSGTGTETAEDFATDLANLFNPSNNPFTSHGIMLIVKSVTRLSAQEDDKKYFFIPVRIQISANSNELPRGRVHEVSGFCPLREQPGTMLLSAPEGRRIKPHLI